MRASSGPSPRELVAGSGFSRAFTLIELVNTLSIVAILSALAMYGVGRYIRYSKTLEAVGSVHAIGQAAVSYFNDSDSTQPAGGAEAAVHAMRHFPPSARASVPKDKEDVRGKVYQSTHADWSPSPWRELNFSIPQPQCYRYSFESSGTGRTSVASAVAQGDLDGSGTESTYRQRITVNEKFGAELAPGIERENVDE